MVDEFEFGCGCPTNQLKWSGTRRQPRSGSGSRDTSIRNMGSREAAQVATQCRTERREARKPHNPKWMVRLLEDMRKDKTGGKSSGKEMRRSTRDWQGRWRRYCGENEEEDEKRG